MRTLVVTPSTTDPISFYRGAWPLKRLRETYGLDFEFSDAINWSSLTNVENLFLHRPFTAQHASVAEIAKNWQCPMWGDYDDWLIDLAIDNPAKTMFDNNVDNVKSCIKALDLCFTTTEHLKGLIERNGGKNVVVVPNAYDHNLFPYAKQKKERLKICLWRGSSTHNHDISSVLPALEKLFEIFPDWSFVFAAHNPSWMFRKKDHPNVHFVGAKNMLEYMHMVWDMAPGIVYHPLTDTDFNRSKSMCSWIEATHAGAAFVAPDFEEFQRPGITNYKAEDMQSFFEKMHSLLANPQMLDDNFNSSADYIASNLTLDKVNEIRWSELKKLHQTK